MDSWSNFITVFLVNPTDPNTGSTAQNISEHAALLSNSDGTVWASSPGFTLQNYDVSVANPDGGSQTHHVNEFDDLQRAFEQGGVSPSYGLRLHRDTYRIVNFDATHNLLYLKKMGGGACVAKSNQAFVIGTFRSDRTATDFQGEAVPQHFGLVNQACEGLQKYLLESNL